MKVATLYNDKKIEVVDVSHAAGPYRWVRSIRHGIFIVHRDNIKEESCRTE